MEEGKNFQREKIRIGEPGYLNENCWLVRTLNYSPAKRCQYCELKFRNCLFFQYLIISLILVFFLLTLSFFIEGEISKLVIISVFTLVIVYGYFFNKSTDKVIESYWAQRKAREALEESKTVLEVKIEARTKELKELAEGLEEEVKRRTAEVQERVEELERFHKLMVGRELKMIELKEEIKKLTKELEKYKPR